MSKKMSKRIAKTNLDERKSKRARASGSDGQTDQKDQDLYQFFKSIPTPLIPDLMNLTSEYLEPCDYLNRPYNYCFKKRTHPQTTLPTFRDITVGKDFDIKQCCRSKCTDLLRILQDPPTYFRARGFDFWLKDPVSVEISYNDSDSFLASLRYDIKSNTFSSDDGKIIWSDLETTCQNLQSWEIDTLSIEYNDPYLYNTEQLIAIDKQYNIRWRMRPFGRSTKIYS